MSYAKTNIRKIALLILNSPLNYVYFFFNYNFGDDLLAWDDPLLTVFGEGFLLCVGDFSENFLVFIRLFGIRESKR